MASPAPTLRRVLAIAEDAPARDQALAWAAEVATRTGADLLAVTANGSDAELAEWAARARRPGRPAPRGRRRGRAVDVAAREQVDLIVVASRGMRDRTGLLLHSVANRVSHAARCSVLLVGDDGPRRSTTPATPPKPDSQLLRRAARIGRVFARHGLRPGSQPADLETRASAMRQALEELGPTFAKLGQLLSTRPDLIPPELVARAVPAAGRRRRRSTRPASRGARGGARRPVGGRVRELRGRRRWPPGRSARSTGRRSRAASGWWSRCSGRPPSRRSCRTWRSCGCSSSGPGAGACSSRSPTCRAVFEHLSASLQRELDYELEAEALERLR